MPRERFLEKLKKGMDIEKPLDSQENLGQGQPEENLTKNPSVTFTSVSAPSKKRPENKTKKKSKIEPKMKKIKVEKEQDGEIIETPKEKKWFVSEGELTVDVYQTSQEIVIQSAVAGIKPEDLDISIENDLIIIKGNRLKPFENEKRSYFHQECYWGPFSREIILPEEVDPSRIKATMKQGVLTIRVPKIEREKKRKVMVKE